MPPTRLSARPIHHNPQPSATNANKEGATSARQQQQQAQEGSKPDSEKGKDTLATIKDEERAASATLTPSQRALTLFKRFPPFFTVQPVPGTFVQQADMWALVLLEHATASCYHKLLSATPATAAAAASSSSASPYFEFGRVYTTASRIFHSAALNRAMPTDACEEVLALLVQHHPERCIDVSEGVDANAMMTELHALNTSGSASSSGASGGSGGGDAVPDANTRLRSRSSTNPQHKGAGPAILVVAEGYTVADLVGSQHKRCGLLGWADAQGEGSSSSIHTVAELLENDALSYRLPSLRQASQVDTNAKATSHVAEVALCFDDSAVLEQCGRVTCNLVLRCLLGCGVVDGATMFNLDGSDTRPYQGVKFQFSAD